MEKIATKPNGIKVHLKGNFFGFKLEGSIFKYAVNIIPPLTGN